MPIPNRDFHHGRLDILGGIYVFKLVSPSIHSFGRLLTKCIILVRKTHTLRSIDQGTRHARGDELRKILNERVKQSTDTAKREIIETLRNYPEFQAFGGIINAAETRIEQMTLTGFSAVATFMKVEAEVNNFLC